jgi:hypothetical protein
MKSPAMTADAQQDPNRAGGTEKGVVHLRWKCSLRGKRQDPWRKANDR